MTSSANPRIDAYIAHAAEYARPVLRHLRALVHQACPAVVETIKWGMPSFGHHGILCHFAAFKAHCAFGFWHQGMKTVPGPDRAKTDDAMGCLGRITGLADLPADRTMLRLLRTAVQLNESGAPARLPANAKTKTAPRVPADLAAALRKHPAAAATFRQFSPSHRREYIGWLTEAKRPETRWKRLGTTLAWLAEGKRLNWKYLKC